MASITPKDRSGLHSRSSERRNGGSQLRSSRSSPSAASTPAPSHSITPDLGSFPGGSCSRYSRNERARLPSVPLPVDDRSALSSRFGYPSSSTTKRSPPAVPSMKSIIDEMVGPTD